MDDVADDNNGLTMVDVDDMVEVYNQRRAVSSGEPSLDGSVDEERGALSDSDLPGAMRIQTLATQAKGPSSDALEAECRAEHPAVSSDLDSNGEGDSAWNDLLANGQLMCKVLRKRRGVKPRNGQEVTIHVVDLKLGVDSVDSLTFVLGFSMVIDAWEMATLMMHIGEEVLIKCESRLAYGTIGDVDRGIPPFQNMVYSIELLRVDDVLPYSTMSRDELTVRITRLKERGNYYYARQEFEKAAFVYKRCTGLVDIPADDHGIRNLLSTIYSNLAVCFAKLCDWKSTLDAADKALELNSSNTKALFRRANAYANLNFIGEAIDTLKIANSVDPDDALVVKELHRLKARQRVCREQERSLCKRMLLASDTDEESRAGRLNDSTFRYALLAFFAVAFALFIHFLRVLAGS